MCYPDSKIMLYHNAVIWNPYESEKKIKFHVILEQLRNFCDITGFHVANVVSLCVYFTDVFITVKLNLL